MDSCRGTKYIYIYESICFYFYISIKVTCTNNISKRHTKEPLIKS